MKLETTLPSSWYRRDDVFALEREHIFFKEWLCVARDEDLALPGEHRVVDVLGQSILVVRNVQGELRAFYNVCRHRGARLCSRARDGELPVRGGVMPGGTILCPYHAWTYDLDGQLLRAPFMAAADGFKTSDIQLYRAGVASWGGFVFVNLSPDAARPFDEQIADVSSRLVRYPLAALRVAASIRYEVAANWKLLCENYNECYHCGPVHPELCRIVPAFRESGGANLDWERGIPHRAGADTFTAIGTSTRRSFPGLNADERVRHKGELVYPNLLLSVAREHVVAFVLEAVSASRTIITCHFLFEAHEMAQPGFDPTDVIDFWHLVNRQDWAICAAVQAGIGARVHEAGLLSPMENWNLDIRRYVSDRIGSLVKK
ncbi:MAG: aromatic ring-hydroxylating oxygenase subunit alpha [Steroidobacterales bacterium]